MANSTIQDKAKRILARLYHDPTWATAGHLELLAGIDDPLLCQARDTIQAGRAAVTAVSDPFLHAALDDILNGHRPAAAALQKRRQLSGLELAADIWPDDKPVMVIPEPGTGEWPKRPAHMCNGEGAAGVVFTIRANETAVHPMITPKWRSDERRPGCPGCYYDRVKRQAEQVLFEHMRLEGLHYAELATAADFKRFTDRARQQRARNGVDGAYRSYPQDDGRYLVIGQVELLPHGTAVPTDRTELYNLLHTYCQTPEGKRVSSSGGWGGPWQGTKGDGRRKYAGQQGKATGPAVQLWASATMQKAADALGAELQRGRRGFSVQMPAADAYERLSMAGLEMHERKTNRSGLAAFLEFLGATVTDKGQENQDKTLSVMRDKQPTEKPPGRGQLQLAGGETA